MEGKRFRVGSVTVLFAVVVLCVAIFCILTALTALNDSRMADRYASHITQVYECQNEGQRWLAQADAFAHGEGQLPENTRQEGDRLETEIIRDSVCLKISVRWNEAGYEILQWDCAAQWQPDQSLTLLQ